MALDTTKTAHEIITSGRSTGQTVIDSDGNLKWAMENLYRNGAGGVQAITVVSGVDYTIRAASGSVAYSGAATGMLNASAGVSRVEVTASTTTLTITPTDATDIAVYRSDLGGMQFDKYGSDYLPNTTAGALYSLGIDYSTGRGGLQVYDAATNLLLNTASLSTQNVTVTATPYTLSFTGTGTVTLSGASTAGPLVGTGADDRVNLKFTPSAGTLTLTVSGSVTFAQLKVGSFACPYIPTNGATVTRGADDLTTLVSSFGYNVNVGTVVAEFVTFDADTSAVQETVSVSDGTDLKRVVLRRVSGNINAAVVSGGGPVQANMTTTSLAEGAVAKVAAGYETDNFAISADGAAVVTDTAGDMPIGITNVYYGSYVASRQLNGLIYRVLYYPFRAPNEKLVEASN